MSLLSLTPAGATCAAWYDAYDRSTVTLDGTRITGVSDKSGGTAYNLANSESTATEHPEYSEGVIKYTADAGQYLKNSSFGVGDWTEVTFLIAYTSTGDADSVLFISADDNSQTGDFSLKMEQDGSGDNADFDYRIDRKYGNMGASATSAFTTNEKRVLSFSFSNSLDTLRITIKGHQATGSPSDTDVYQYYAGSKTETDNLDGTTQAGLLIGNSTTSSPDSIAINIHEVAIYDKYMDATTLAPIEEYFLNHGPPKAPAQSPPSLGLGIKSRRG